MLSHAIRMAVVCCLAVTVFLGETYGGSSGEGKPTFSLAGTASADAGTSEPESGQPRESPPSAIEELSQACRSAKDAFTPRTDAHLQEAKAGLLAAVARLDSRLKAAGPVGDGWRAFLDWQGLQHQLTADTGPDLTALDAIYARYASGHNGLELAQFSEVRQALRRYLTTARAIGNPKVKEQYEALLDGLSEQIKTYHNNPTTDGAEMIGASVRWLEEAGQAADLIEAIRDHYASANMFVEVAADLISAGMAGPIDDTGPVRDNILGTRITGTEHTTGQITVELIPREEFAEISLLFHGTIHSDTVGYNGPARVTSEGVTHVAARKAIRIDAEKVWTEPAQSNAVTNSTLKRVSVPGRGGIAQRTAWQRASAQRRQAEQIAARHAEQRTNKRIDRETEKQLGSLPDDFQNKFRNPLLQRNLFPQLLHIYTTEAALHAVALHGGPAGLGVCEPPPALQGEYDLTLRVHESLANNFAAAAWAGMIVEEERFRADVTELLQSTPPWLEPDDQAQPWTITFARRRPLSFTFADDRFTVTLRGRKFIRGGTSYPGMNVTAVYQIQRAEGGLKAVRQGELAIFPPGFTPGQGKQLSTRQQVLRSLLERRFAKIFEPEIIPEPLVLPGALEKAGELALAAWESSGGWMLLGWNRIPVAEEAANAPTEGPTGP